MNAKSGTTPPLPPRKQAAKDDPNRNSDGTFAIGNVPKSTFRDHPENRSSGHWRRDSSITYQYRRFLAMTADEFAQWQEYVRTAEGRAQVTNAQLIASIRVASSLTEKGLADTKEITDRLDGKPPQGIILEETQIQPELTPMDVDRMEQALAKVQEIKKKHRLEKQYQQRDRQ